MLTDRLQDQINRQINSELYSAHLYLSMSAYFETLSLTGFAHWMKLQYHEEVAHALKLFESPHTVVRMALEHERSVTSMINDLYALAVSERDYPSHVLLEWFVAEQVEEEKVLTELVDHMDLIGDDGTGLLILDARLGDRTAEDDGGGEGDAA